MRPKRFLAYLTLVIFSLIPLSQLHAAPYGPEGLPVEWTQPDGTKLSLRVFGDEFYARTETLDGFTVVRNPADNAYHYAKLSKDGQELVPSGRWVNGKAPAGLAKKLRASPEARRAAWDKRYKKLAPTERANWAKRVQAARQRKGLDDGAPARQNDAGDGATGGSSTPEASSPEFAPVVGNYVGLTILVQFPDDPATGTADPTNFPTTKAAMESYSNQIGYTGGGNSGSVRDYFLAQSLNQTDYTQVVTEIVTLPQPRAYYNWSNYPTNTTLRDGGLTGRLVLNDAITILKAQGFDFTGVTRDGSNRVVATNVLFAGATSGVWPDGLWPHRWSLSPQVNVGTTQNPIYIYDYQITNAQTSSVPIGTFIHENGHLLLKYPDLYDYGNDGDSRGVGNHCLMGGGNHLNNGKTPCPINGYFKDVSGWSNVVDITTSQFFTDALPTTNNEGYRIRKPGTTTEYFLVENRGTGDPWAQYVPDKGILIWHIDETVNGNENQHMTAAKHYEVSLEQADGLFDLEMDRDQGDSADAFDSTYPNFNDSTTPDAKWWSGSNSGIHIQVQSAAGASMNVQFGMPPNTITVVSPNGGEQIYLSATQNITWQSNTAGNVKIELFKGGVLNSVLSASEANDGSYSWVVSSGLAPGNDYSIKISSVDTPAYTDSSNATFSILANSITVVAPNGGEQFYIGSPQNITWNPNVPGNVKIELFKGGVLNSVLSANEANDGSYTWLVSSGFPIASDYTIKISSVSTPAITDTSNAAFSLVANPLIAALDAPDLLWANGGDVRWFSQSTTTKDGIDAAESGNITHSQSSSMETTVTGPGTLTFWWKVSSESGWDWLTFYLNNVAQTGDLVRISGTVDWVQKTVAIPSGSQTIKWTYSKDDSVDAGSDAAWVDQVVYTPSSAPEIAVEQPLNTNLTDGSATIDFGSVTSGSSGTPITFTIRNPGTANLTGLALSKSGTHNADYVLGTLGATSLAPNATTTFTVTFSPSAVGTRTAAIQIASNDSNENPFDINLTGAGLGPGTLSVTTGDLVSTGTYGAGFSPSSKIYTLSNPGGTPINWTAAKTAAWVDLDATGGTLAGGANTTVTASINPTANTLNVGGYSDTISFTSSTTGNTTRGVSLTVNPIAATVNLSNLLQIYNGSIRPVTVTTTPANLAHTVTYNGSSTVPTNGGTYAVVATITEPNYAGSASGNLNIAYTVSYQGNGNTSGTVPADQTKFHDVDLTLAANSGNLNKADYSFAGWNTAVDGSGTAYASGGNYSGNNSMTLYAQWVPGADGTWSRTTAGPFNWNDSANWSGGTIASGTDRTANFTPNITATQIVNLESPRTIGNITFTDSSSSSHNLTISGANALTLSRSTGTPAIDVTQSGRTLTISSEIAGSNGLQKSGSGVLDLRGGTNTYSGSTVVNGGQITINSDANLGAATGDILFTGNATLRTEGTLTLSAGRTITINSGVTATLTSTNDGDTFQGVLEGSGTLFANHTTSFIFNNSANTFTGAIRSATGNNNGYGLQFASLGDEAGSGNITIESGGGSFRWAGATQILDERQFILAGSGWIGNITNNALTIAKNLGFSGTGTRTLSLGTILDGSLKFSGNLSDNGASALVVNISPMSNGTSSNGGTVYLSGTNTYSGLTTISTASNGGFSKSNTVVIQGKQALSPNTSLALTRGNHGAIVLKLLDDAGGINDSTVNLSNNMTYTTGGAGLTFFVGNNHTGNDGTSTGTTSGVTMAMGDLVLTATGSGLIHAITGANGYRMQINDLILPNANNAVTSTFNATTAPITIAGTVQQASSANTGALTLGLGGSASGSLISGNILDSADGTPRILNISKSGSGIWVLSGNNSYTGTTSVGSGKLFINGDQSLATGDMSVASNATLGGTGVIGGHTTIASGGKLEFSISTNNTNHDGMSISAGRDFTFSGTSTLTITSTGGASPGIYTLITGGNNIIGSAPSTLVLPADWAATVSISGNSLLLNVTSTGGPGPVDHFVISGVPSQTVVGTQLTGISITAKDAANQTATSFTSTVSFGGTAGITGTSGSFVSGVLSGVNITPIVVGGGLTLTVNDGSSHTGSATFTVQSLFTSWSGGTFTNPFIDIATSGNPDGDSLNNLQEFAFGMDPTSSALSPLSYQAGGNVIRAGTPMMENAGTSQAPSYRVVFMRRKDYQMAGLTYTVQFTADLGLWTASAEVATTLTGENSDIMEVVSVPFPGTVPVTGGGPAQAPKFFRVAVNEE